MVKTDLLKRVSPEHTKGLPSFLPLARGMRYLLSSKDCVRLGIMKGCPVILRDIVFADDELLPQEHVAGHAHSIRYMPGTLLLQAENAPWTLPPSELPEDLPQNIDRRGLFQLRPSHDYLRVPVDNDFISVRRTSFLMTPADTITVYAAQGGTFEAIVADMKRPPNLELSKHWLACYVMLSRSRSLNGFLILRPATRKELEARPPKYLLDEIDRLLRLETRSHQELVEYIESLPLDVPPHIRDLLEVDAPRRELEAVTKKRHVCFGAPHMPSTPSASAGPSSQNRIGTRLRKKTTLNEDGCHDKNVSQPPLKYQKKNVEDHVRNDKSASSSSKVIPDPPRLHPEEHSFQESISGRADGVFSEPPDQFPKLCPKLSSVGMDAESARSGEAEEDDVKKNYSKGNRRTWHVGIRSGSRRRHSRCHCPPFP